MRRDENVIFGLMKRSKINRETGCVEWQGGTDGRGYWRPRINRRKQRCHRLMFAEVHGPIPDGFTVCTSAITRAVSIRATSSAALTQTTWPTRWRRIGSRNRRATNIAG